jgi:hypothetical protein
MRKTLLTGLVLVSANGLAAGELRRSNLVDPVAYPSFCRESPPTTPEDRLRRARNLVGEVPRTGLPEPLRRIRYRLEVNPEVDDKSGRRLDSFVEGGVIFFSFEVSDKWMPHIPLYLVNRRRGLLHRDRSDWTPDCAIFEFQSAANENGHRTVVLILNPPLLSASLHATLAVLGGKPIQEAYWGDERTYPMQYSVSTEYGSNDCHTLPDGKIHQSRLLRDTCKRLLSNE